MGSYALAAANPPSPTLEGDQSGFIGWANKHPPYQLPPGYYYRGENKRCFDGVIRDRPGTQTPVFANNFTATSILGSNVYTNVNGREMCLLATPNKVVAIRSGAPTASITTLNNPIGNIEFSPQFDEVLMHSDDNTFATLVWDGISADGFVAVVPSPVALTRVGIVNIPKVPWSINYLGRAWFPLPDEPGWFAASDINDYTLYDSIQHKFRATSGKDVGIVGLYPYRAQVGLIIGKRRSFNLLGPIPGDLGDSFLVAIELGLAPASNPPPVVTSIKGPDGIGLVARKAALWVGRKSAYGTLIDDFHFLSDYGSGGIYRMSSTSGELTIDPVPISDPIAPFFERINWPFASGACANSDGLYAYWAVPIDGAQFNNAVIVYNMATEQWMGVDLWFGRTKTGRKSGTQAPIPNILRMDNLIGFEFYGRRRIYAIDNVLPAVRLMYEGREDKMASSNKIGTERKTWPITSVVETRGYATLSASGNTFRKMSELQMVLSTYDPNYIITEIAEGAGNEEVKTSFAADRTQYLNQGIPSYDVSNKNNDFMAPNREDYAIHTGDDFEVMGTNPPGTTQPTMVEVEQERTEDLSLTRDCRYVSYRINNNSGNCALVATVVESEEQTRTERVAA